MCMSYHPRMLREGQTNLVTSKFIFCCTGLQPYQTEGPMKARTAFHPVFSEALGVGLPMLT